MNFCLKMWISAQFLGSQIFFSVWWKCFRINYGWYPENGCGLRLGQIARDARTSKQFEKKYPVMKSTSVWSDAVLEFSLWLNRALVLCYLSFFSGKWTKKILKRDISIWATTRNTKYLRNPDLSWLDAVSFWPTLRSCDGSILQGQLHPVEASLFIRRRLDRLFLVLTFSTTTSVQRWSFNFLNSMDILEALLRKRMSGRFIALRAILVESLY